MKAFRNFMLGVIWGGLPALAFAQGQQTLTQIFAGTGNSAEFGYAMAGGTKYFWVGAPYYDGSGGTDRGSVDMFMLKDFMPITQTLQNSDGRYGFAIASYKSLVLIGEPGGHVPGQTHGGLVYYHTDNSTTGGIIVNPDPGNFDNFGAAVAASAKLEVIGAPQDIDGPQKVQCGAAFVALKATPASPIRLTPPVYGDQDEIGFAVAASAKFIAVGAPSADSDLANNVGSVYIYDAKTLQYVTALQAFDILDAPRFGSALSFSGNYLFVGAPLADKVISVINHVNDVGAVYQYDTKTWQVVRTYLSAEPQADAHFGTSIIADKKQLVVGSPDYDNQSAGRGRAELFDLKTGSPLQTLYPPMDYANQFYGRSVALLKGNRLAVGAPWTGSTTSNAGRVYVYSLSK